MMNIEEAKNNIMRNFRANYTGDHGDHHDIEVFLLNAMEQLEEIVKNNLESNAHKIVMALSKILDLKHITPDQSRFASMCIENYNKQKEIDYINSLRNRIDILQQKIEELQYDHS